MKSFFRKIGAFFGKAWYFVTNSFGVCLKLLGLVLLCIPFFYLAIILFAVAFEIAPTLTYIALGMLVLLYLFFKLRRVLRRRTLLRSLEKICESRGGRLTLSGHPFWNALFRVRASAQMELREKTITLYFLSCLKKGTCICFTRGGAAVYYESIRFRRVDFFSWKHIYRWADEPEKGSYLLLTPAPNRCYVEWIRPELEVDNGSRCGNYEIFTGGAFLRHIERVL